jgi:hypothetical protein
MKQNLADFLSKKQQSSDAIDWDERRNKYLAAVDNLYEQIEALLAGPIQQKTVKLQRRSKQLTENYIGTYSVDDLILVIGGEQVRFSPRGRNIVGAAGRVDVVGERGEAALILQPDSSWGVVQTRQPTLIIVPFEEPSLTDILKLIMRD